MKKGQVGIFVIVGVVILLIIGIVFFYKLVYQKEKQEIQERKLIGVPSQFLPVETVIEGCFKDTAEQAVRHVALHGGYFDPKPAMSVIINDTTELPEFLQSVGEGEERFFEVFDNRKIKVGYWYYNGQPRVPPIGFIESQISLYINEYLSLCLGDLVYMDDFVYTYENITIKSGIKITNKNVVASLHYPLGVSSKGITYTIKDKSVVIPIDFNSLYETAGNIVKKTQEKPGMIPLTYFATLNYNISIYPNENDLAYGVTDGKTTLMFGNKIA